MCCIGSIFLLNYEKIHILKNKLDYSKSTQTMIGPVISIAIVVINIAIGLAIRKMAE